MIAPIYSWKETPLDIRTRILRRSEEDITQVSARVEKIVSEVRAQGDIAVAQFTAQFDWQEASVKSLWVQPSEIKYACASLDPQVKAALDYAIENVKKFHASQVPSSMHFVEVRPGLLAGERHTPVDKVAIYVPRGRGSFPSTLYMLAVPAMLAGVKEVIVVTPPGKDGTIDAACLYAAQKCGVHRILRCGGAQAIAALAYGTEKIPKVDKIIGPGSAYVTAAKRLVSGLVDIGLPAGPSESVIIADDSSHPRLVAFDLLIEAEHGADSSALLLTWSKKLALSVQKELENIIPLIPGQRQEFVRSVMANYGGIILLENENEAAELCNTIAPEHLMIQTSSLLDSLSLVHHASEILLGPHTPFSIANYASGPNAVLPTGGKARTWSAVSVRDFMHTSSIVQTSPQAYKEIADHVITLADYEGFWCHAEALRERKRLNIPQ